MKEALDMREGFVGVEKRRTQDRPMSWFLITGFTVELTSLQVAVAVCGVHRADPPRKMLTFNL